MDGEFAGDGADLPMFGVKIAADLRAGFVTNHEESHLCLGMRGYRSMKRPIRPQMRQRSDNDG